MGAAKAKAEDEALKKKQEEEIKEIEDARIEVLLDDSHSKALAQGVTEWRKKQEKAKKLGVPTTKRQKIKEIFSTKSRELEELVAESRARQMEAYDQADEGDADGE